VSLEQRKVTVHLIGVADTRTGEAWAYRLRGGPLSERTYSTPEDAKRAGNRAIKEQGR
jgi:hypothetical protein